MVKNVGDMMPNQHEGITKRGLRDGFSVLDDSHQEYYWMEYRNSDESGNTRARDEDDPLPAFESESYPGFLRRARGDER